MPMKPARPDRNSADQRKPNATARRTATTRQDNDKYHCADNGDGGILTGEIGGRAFLDRAGDFLHAGIASIGRHERTAIGPDGIGTMDRTPQAMTSQSVELMVSSLC